MKIFISLCIVIVLSGCSKTDIAQYRNNQPTLSLFEYFTGETKGWGTVQDRNGNLTKYFVVEIEGKVNNDTLTLFENFTWDNGEQSTRTWSINRTGDHTFSGTAEDVDGPAVGSSYGNVLNWKYILLLATDDSQWKIALDDWMFLLPDGVLLNRTKMSKFGIHLGDITITFRKTES